VCESLCELDFVTKSAHLIIDWCIISDVTHTQNLCNYKLICYKVALNTLYIKVI